VDLLKCVEDRSYVNSLDPRVRAVLLSSGILVRFIGSDIGVRPSVRRVLLGLRWDPLWVDRGPVYPTN